MTKSKIDANTLHELIMVTPPYNKLYKLNLNPDNSLSAKVDNEYLYELESAPIGVAEAGRHVAILGSMVLANDYQFGEKCYFLATHANVTRASKEVQTSETLNLRVKTTVKDKRTASISGQVFDLNKQLIFSLNVTYQILRKNVFTKLYKKNYIDNYTPKKTSPYINRKKFQEIRIDNTQAIGIYGEIEPSDCQGHFKNYPALPVAIIGNLFIELGMLLFKKIAHKPFTKIIVLKTEVKALRLAFASEQISFSTKIKERKSSGTIVMYDRATINKDMIANMQFELMSIA